MIDISVIILTFNSEATIEKTIKSAMEVSKDIHIVDSFSSDRTLDIVGKYNANIVQHEYENYSAQRNWAIQNLDINNGWQLHLDADECLTSDLIAEIDSLSPPAPINGYMIARLVHFLGRPILHGGMYPIWHMRLFRSGYGRCEQRLYDQHFFVQGDTFKLKNPIVDDHRNSLTEWVARHNRWSDAEVEEITRSDQQHDIESRFLGNPIQKKRAYKNLYYRIPLFLRAFLIFFYRYFIRLGFLDGREGLIFFTLQTFWFRFLVDAKLYEKKKKNTNYLEKSSHDGEIHHTC